jgi:hypothetical protein
LTKKVDRGEGCEGRPSWTKITGPVHIFEVPAAQTVGSRLGNLGAICGDDKDEAGRIF